MSIEPGLVDANILVYAADTGAPQYVASNGLLQAARDPATLLCLTSQVLCEFYSIVTNPRRIAAPYSSSEALQAISDLLALPGIRVLPITEQAVAGWTICAWCRRFTIRRSVAWRWRCDAVEPRDRLR
ncbi:MAG TPA: PIN domain-containing protein [Bryobacteraceae bacterium]|nr:PIN domain-containing protein [Bryobacteraceae bacterium]